LYLTKIKDYKASEALKVR